MRCWAARGAGLGGAAPRGGGEVGEQGEQVGSQAGAVGRAEALFELVGVQPARRGVLAERFGHPLALGVGGEDFVGGGDERVGRHGT